MFSKSLLLPFLSLVAVACQRPDSLSSDHSKISIETAELRRIMTSKNAIMGDPGLPADSESCYAAELSSKQSPGVNLGACAAPSSGLGAGFVKAGETLTLNNVSYGDYHLRLFLFRRASGASCDSFSAVLGDPAKQALLYKVGETSVSIQKPEENVSIAVDFPGAGRPLASVRPSSCLGQIPPSAALKIVVGKTEATGPSGERYALKVVSRGVVK